MKFYLLSYRITTRHRSSHSNTTFTNQIHNGREEDRKPWESILWRAKGSNYRRHKNKKISRMKIKIYWQFMRWRRNSGIRWRWKHHGAKTMFIGIFKIAKQNSPNLTEMHWKCRRHDGEQGFGVVEDGDSSATRQKARSLRWWFCAHVHTKNAIVTSRFLISMIILVFTFQRA